MLDINMFEIFAGINVHSGRLNSFKAGINKFNILIRFSILCVLSFFVGNIRLFYSTTFIKIGENA